MDKDFVFTQGNQPNGLNNEHEIRILVCFILNSVGVPVTFTQLNHALQLEGLVNYFEFAQSISKLTNSGHITAVNVKGEKEQCLMLSDLGKRAAINFEKSIPLAVREKALKSTKDCVLRQKIESDNKVRIDKTIDGFKITLTIPDVGTDLMKLCLFVPTLDLCNKIKDRFLIDPTICYRGVIEILTDEHLPETNMTEILG